jgi:hypothetical protein
MIYLQEEPPLIELGSGAVALDHDWLAHCLGEAAFAAGYPDWPASDVARTVTDFLHSRRTPKPFSFEGFTSAVQLVLQDIGYKEVATHFLRDGLEVRYSLLEVVEELPPGFELGLFRACADLCKRLLSSGAVSRISLDNLKPAIKKALSRTHWCPSCEILAGELVTFIREHLLKVAPTRRLTFSIR